MPADAGAEMELVRAARLGSRDAFALLVKKYQASVASMAYALTGSISASEEITQDAFLAAWRQLAALKKEGAFRSWLWRIVRNLSVEYRRQQVTRTGSRGVAHHDVDDVPSSDPSPLDRLLSNEDARALWQALSRIPEAYRLALVLYYREENSVETVADMLGLEIPAAKKRLSRGRRLLHDEAFVASAVVRSRPTAALTALVLAALSTTPAPSASAAVPGRRPRSRAGGPVLWGGLATALVSATVVIALVQVHKRRASHRYPPALTAATGTRPATAPLLPALPAREPAAAGIQPVVLPDETGAGEEPTTVHDYDFESGRLPEIFSAGRVVSRSGPSSSRFCLFGSTVADRPDVTGVEANAPPGAKAFLHHSNRLFVQFDYWLPAGGHTLTVSVFNAAKQTTYSGSALRGLKTEKAPGIHENWTHAQFNLSSIAVPRQGTPMDEGDVLTSLRIEVQNPERRPFYVDNIRIVRYPRGTPLPRTGAAIPFDEKGHPWNIDLLSDAVVKMIETPGP